MFNISNMKFTDHNGLTAEQWKVLWQNAAKNTIWGEDGLTYIMSDDEVGGDDLDWDIPLDEKKVSAIQERFKNNK